MKTGRVPVDYDAIYDTYYKDKGYPKRAFKEIWREISVALGISGRLLLPSDRFSKELAPPSFFLLFDISEKLMDKGKERVTNNSLSSDIESRAIKSLNDYVEFFIQ